MDTVNKRYCDMQLSELKKVAKGRGIKHYYILPKAELLRLLDAGEIPMEIRLQKKTIQELRKEAKERGISVFWPLPRQELLELLYPNYCKRDPNQGAADQDQKNQSDANKHDEPEKHHA